MTVAVEALRTLHRVHRQLGDLKSRLTRGPKLVHSGELAVARSEQELAAAKELSKQARKESADQQLTLKERDGKIADLQKKLNECKTNVEFKLLKDHIAAEKQANAVLEDEILDKLEKIDRLQQEVHELEAKLAKAREELEKTRTRVENEQATLSAEVARVSTQLEQAELALPEDCRVEYERISKSRGEAAMAPVEGECCGGCYTTLTTQTMHLLQMSQLVFCKSCGCLLYLPEEPLAAEPSA